MKNEGIKDPPTTSFFFIFGTYGLLLMILLTSMFWYWSGLTSLGTFALILVAPFIMGYIAYYNRNKHEISPYH